MSYLGKYQDPAIAKANAEALRAGIARIAAIENERFDISYKDFRPQPEKQLTPGEKRVLEDELMARGGYKKRQKGKKISADAIWNAGRYAAGARDAQAQEGHALLQASRDIK